MPLTELRTYALLRPDGAAKRREAVKREHGATPSVKSETAPATVNGKFFHVCH
jgi:hypothetical protein